MITTGTKFGPYEITGQLGAGGMGEVYRARDTRLGRDVAIKVLSGHFVSSPNLKERFEREARTISQLSHANICHLYDVGSQEGTDYLVMEYLEGESLADRLARVLYEMATGKRAFAGKTQASVIASILASEPMPLSRLAPMTPPALERLVRSCMAKEREERVQSAHDVKLQLEWIAEAGSQAGVPAPVIARRKVSQRLAWSIAAVAVAAAIAFAVGFVLRAPAPQHALRVSILPPEKHAFDPLSIALSPDGSKLAFVASNAGQAAQLWVRPLDSTAAQPLAGTEGAQFPFWSPDSRSVGFFSQAKLKTIDAGGGAVQTLAEATDPRGAAWGAEGTILYAPNPGTAMLRMPAAGGSASPAIPRDKANLGLISERWPSFLPDGKHFIFF